MSSIATGQGQSITQAYTALRDLIVRGTLGPGSRLIERELGDHLQMSRSPVRSALERLQHEGYVMALDGERKRLVVAPLTRADVSELYRLLGFLDGEAARWAAGLAPSARAEIVDRMRATSRQLERVAEDSPFDARKFFDLDTEFHNHYLTGPDTPRLSGLYDAIRPQADRYRLFYTSGDHVGSLESVIDEHRAIVEAIAAGDADRAAENARANWQRAAERVNAIMEIAGERGTF